MKRLEAVCDAIAQYHHYGDPESEAYELRNPGLIHDKQTGSKRVFSCHRAGYAALLDVVKKQCAANPDAHLPALLETLGIKMRVQQEQAIDFMTRCANSTLNSSTSLNWFLEG